MSLITEQNAAKTPRQSKNHLHQESKPGYSSCVICGVSFVDDPDAFVEPELEPACEVCDIVGQCSFTCSLTLEIEGLPVFGSAINAFDDDSWEEFIW
jgi:hypothetical protein